LVRAQTDPAQGVRSKVVLEHKIILKTINRNKDPNSSRLWVEGFTRKDLRTATPLKFQRGTDGPTVYSADGKVGHGAQNKPPWKARRERPGQLGGETSQSEAREFLTEKRERFDDFRQNLDWKGTRSAGSRSKGPHRRAGSGRELGHKSRSQIRLQITKREGRLVDRKNCTKGLEHLNGKPQRPRGQIKKRGGQRKNARREERVIRLCPWVTT